MNNKKIQMGLLAYFVQKNSGNIGKTALMKFMFFLQYAYSLSLGYRFSMYTYGPFAQEVLEDIDYAKYYEVIVEEVQNDGYGYKYTTGVRADVFLNETEFKSYLETNQEKIDSMLDYFSKKSVADLEIQSTIIYFHQFFLQNNIDLEKVASAVQSVKPRFALDKINSYYQELKKKGLCNLPLLKNMV